jgi:hypothetical protein
MACMVWEGAQDKISLGHLDLPRVVRGVRCEPRPRRLMFEFVRVVSAMSFAVPSGCVFCRFRRVDAH